MARGERFTLGIKLTIALALLCVTFAGVVYLALADARWMAATIRNDLDRQNEDYARQIESWYDAVTREHARQIAAPFLWNVESLHGLEEGSPAFRRLQRRMWQFVYGKDEEPLWQDAPVGPLESVLIIDREHRIVAASDPMVVDRRFNDPQEIARIDAALEQPQLRRIAGERADGRSVVELSVGVPNAQGLTIGVVRLRYVGGEVGQPPAAPELVVPEQPRFLAPALAGLVAVLGVGFGLWATIRVFGLTGRLKAMAQGVRLPKARGVGQEALSVIEERLETLSHTVRRDDLLVASLSDALREGVILLDPQGEPVVANRHTEVMLQLEDEDPTERLPRIAGLLRRNPALHDVVVAGLERQSAVREQTMTLMVPWGHAIGVQVTSYLLRDGDRTAGILLVVKDRSSIEVLERNLREASRLQTIVRLTGSVAHEVKNPLGAISIHLEQLRRKLRAIEGGEQALGERVAVIKEEIGRLREILEEWLSTTAPEERAPALAPADEVLESVGRLLRVEARHQGVELIVEHEGGSPRVSLSSARLRQVLLNLALNGLQVMPSGGRLVLRLRVEGHKVVFEIEDSGPGIDPQLRERIFELHFTTRSGGSVLGLPICRMLVEEAGGILTFLPAPGKDTTFQIFLPIAHAAARPLERQEPAS